MDFLKTISGFLVSVSVLLSPFDAKAVRAPVIFAGNSAALFTLPHLKSAPMTTTATVNANAGSTGACTLSDATDVAGTVNLTTGSGSWVLGEQCKVNFVNAYGVAPICVYSPASANAAAAIVAKKIYVTTTTAKLSINFGVADTAGTAYVFTYYCIETQ